VPILEALFEPAERFFITPVGLNLLAGGIDSTSVADAGVALDPWIDAGGHHGRKLWRRRGPAGFSGLFRSVGAGWVVGGVVDDTKATFSAGFSARRQVWQPI
jgi:hypothetical protein